MSESAETYTRPEGMSDKQEEIIQYVAKYVVASCDSAKYQKKLRMRTKYNSFFAFLDAKHPYNNHYTYLVQSYRYWMEQAKAMEQSNLLSGIEDDVHGNANAHQNYYAYGDEGTGADNYLLPPPQQQQQHNPSAGGASDYYGGSSGAENAYYTSQQQQQGYSNHQSEYFYGTDPTAPPATDTSSSAVYGGGSMHNSSDHRYHPTTAGGAGPHPDEDGEDEEYEMVLQNGVQTLVPKRR